MLAVLCALAAGCGGDDDEALDGLVVSEATLTPAFDPDVFEYSAEVDNDVASVTVTATLADAAASVTVNGADAASGEPSAPIALAVGDNTVTVAVTEEDGDVSTYTIVVTRLPPPGNDPALASLELTAGPLDQIFDGDLTSYTASVGHLGASTRVTAVPAEARAEIVLNGNPLPAGEPSDAVPLAVGDNTLELEVTAEDGSETRRYEVEVTRADENTLQQEAYVKASNTGPDFFGASLSLSRDTLVVGAPSEGSADAGIDGDESDNSLTDAGAVYVFDRSGTTWVQSAYVKASNPGDPDLFGTAVAIDGDRLVVGAEGEQSLATGVDGDQDDDSGDFAGAAYLFERDGSDVWQQVAYLKASNADDNDAFGTAVDVDGERVIVGAWSEDSDSVGIDGDGVNDDLPGAGAAYVFVRDESAEWRQEAYLKASNTGGQDEFGSAVAIGGRTAVVAAPSEDSNATGVNGLEDDDSLSSAGAVYVFDVDDEGVWSQTAYLKASNTDAGDFFGVSLSLDGDLLAVGAPGEAGGDSGIDADPDDDTVGGAGAVYVFERDSDGNWSQAAYVKASNPGFNDAFGSAVSLSGNVLVVGAPGESSSAAGLGGDELDDSAPDAGAVYVFERDEDGDWRQRLYVKASNTGGGDELGGAVGFDGDTLAAGAAFEDGGDTGVNGDDTDDSVTGAGAVYIVR